MRCANENQLVMMMRVEGSKSEAAEKMPPGEAHPLDFPFHRCIKASISLMVRGSKQNPNSFLLSSTWGLLV